MGFAGDEGISIDCLWDKVASGQASSGGGVAKTTQELHAEETFLNANWDFVTPVWIIEDGEGYPCLWWNADDSDVPQDVNDAGLPSDLDFHAVPGRIEAEGYVQMQGIDTEATSDSGGGLNVGWLGEGDWLEYAIDVQSSAYYDVDLRIARLVTFSEGKGCLKLGGETLISFSVPGTGGWQNWRTITVPVELPAGKHILRLFVEEGDWNINWMEFRRASRR